MSDTNSNDNSGYTCPLTVPSMGVCSSHGNCIDGKCQCIDGFYGRGDFAVEPFADCDIHINAVMGLHGLLCFVASMLALLCLRYFKLRYEMMKERPEQKWSDHVNLIVFSAFGMSISLLVYASLKLSNPYNNGVGLSFASTFFLGVIFNVFWLTESLYLYFFASLVIKQSRMKSNEFKQRSVAMLSSMKKSLIISCVLNLIWGFLPMGTLVHPKSTYTIGAIHYVGAGLNIFFLANFISPRVLKPIRDDIREALKAKGYETKSSKSMLMKEASQPSVHQVGASDKLKGQNIQRLIAMDQAQKKLNQSLEFILRTGFQELVLACLFGLWPFLQRKTSYQLPSTYSFGTMLLILQVYSVSNFNREKKQQQGTGGAGSNPNDNGNNNGDDDDQLDKPTSSSPSRDGGSYMKQQSMKSMDDGTIASEHIEITVNVSSSSSIDKQHQHQNQDSNEDQKSSTMLTTPAL